MTALVAGGSQDLLEPIPREEMLVDSSYVCNFCNEKFKNYYQLKTHLRQHKDEQVMSGDIIKISNPEILHRNLFGQCLLCLVLQTEVERNQKVL